MTQSLDEWMTVPAAAREKQVAESAVRLAIHVRRLRGRKVGGRYLVSRADVAQWMPVRGAARQRDGG